MTFYEILMLIGIPSIVAIIFETIFNIIKSKYNNDKIIDQALRKGEQALLRDRLLQAYRFHMGRKYITLLDKENYENMYQCYHALGKNGVMDGCYKEVMNLPVKNDL